jgi:sulfide:quinone oxidoreductase
MQVDDQTLQHPKYHNVFGMGDVVGLNTGKSGGAAREQGFVLQDNIAAHLENKKLPMQYNGYSVAPIKTAYGKILLAEYNKNGLAPTLPFSLDKPRWIWWAIDVHLMRRAYFELIMRGMM